MTLVGSGYHCKTSVSSLLDQLKTCVWMPVAKLILQRTSSGSLGFKLKTVQIDVLTCETATVVYAIRPECSVHDRLCDYDRIVRVNGVDVTRSSQDNVIALMRNNPTNDVILHVSKPKFLNFGTKNESSFELKPETDTYSNSPAFHRIVSKVSDDSGIGDSRHLSQTSVDSDTEGGVADEPSIISSRTRCRLKSAEVECVSITLKNLLREGDVAKRTHSPSLGSKSNNHRIHKLAKTGYWTPEHQYNTYDSSVALPLLGETKTEPSEHDSLLSEQAECSSGLNCSPQGGHQSCSNSNDELTYPLILHNKLLISNHCENTNACISIPLSESDPTDLFDAHTDEQLVDILQHDKANIKHQCLDDTCHVTQLHALTASSASITVNQSSECSCCSAMNNKKANKSSYCRLDSGEQQQADSKGASSALPSELSVIMQQQVLKNPHLVIWDAETKTITLEKTKGSMLGLSYKVKYSKDTGDVYTLIDQIKPTSLLYGRLFVGDWIRSVNGRPLHDTKEAVRLNKYVDKCDALKFVIQRPKNMTEKRSRPKENRPLESSSQHNFDPSRKDRTTHRQQSRVSKGTGANIPDSASPLISSASERDSSSTRHEYTRRYRPKKASLDRSQKHRNCTITRNESEKDWSVVYSNSNLCEEVTCPVCQIFISGSKSIEFYQLLCGSGSIHSSSAKSNYDKFFVCSRVKLKVDGAGNMGMNCSLCLDNDEETLRCQHFASGVSEDDIVIDVALSIRDEFTEFHVKDTVFYLDVYCILDENFFSTCFPRLFCKTSLFIVTFDGLKVLRHSSDLSNISDSLFLIQTHLSDQAPVALYGFIEEDSMERFKTIADELQAFFYTDEGEHVLKFGENITLMPDFIMSNTSNSAMTEVCSESVQEAIYHLLTEHEGLRRTWYLATLLSWQQLNTKRQSNVSCVTSVDLLKHLNVDVDELNGVSSISKVIDELQVSSQLIAIDSPDSKDLFYIINPAYILERVQKVMSVLAQCETSLQSNTDSTVTGGNQCVIPYQNLQTIISDSVEYPLELFVQILQHMGIIYFLDEDHVFVPFLCSSSSTAKAQRLSLSHHDSNHLMDITMESFLPTNLFLEFVMSFCTDIRRHTQYGCMTYVSLCYAEVALYSTVLVFYHAQSAKRIEISLRTDAGKQPSLTMTNIVHSLNVSFSSIVHDRIAYNFTQSNADTPASKSKTVNNASSTTITTDKVLTTEQTNTRNSMTPKPDIPIHVHVSPMNSDTPLPNMITKSEPNSGVLSSMVLEEEEQLISGSERLCQKNPVSKPHEIVGTIQPSMLNSNNPASNIQTVQTSDEKDLTNISSDINQISSWLPSDKKDYASSGKAFYASPRVSSDIQQGYSGLTSAKSTFSDNNLIFSSLTFEKSCYASDKALGKSGQMERQSINSSSTLPKVLSEGAHISPNGHCVIDRGVLRLPVGYHGDSLAELAETTDNNESDVLLPLLSSPETRASKVKNKTFSLDTSVVDLPYIVLHGIILRLSILKPFQRDWRSIACYLEKTGEEVELYETAANPAKEILIDWARSDQGTLGGLIKMLQQPEVDRQDIIEFIRTTINFK